MLWLIQTVGAVLIGILLTAVAAYAVYKLRERPKVSVEIVADTMRSIKEIAIVVTNHGRVPVVITELSVYVPAEQIMPDWPAPNPPAVVTARFHKLRRVFRTFGSKNDLHALGAKKILADGAVKSGMMDETETLTVMPKEKGARRFDRRGPRVGAPMLELPNTLTLVPSCRAFGRQHEVWGSPAIMSFAEIGGQVVPVVVMSFPTLHPS